MFRNPSVVASGMVGHPVDYHFESHFMGFAYHCLEIVHCTEFRIESLIVGHCIVAAERALALFFGYGVYGHEP